ncbi:uncharacterized protein LOC115441757 isoform X2 [Manduca sexta]|uniref:uncharacterized protein LOC115441757 isoform X2 n=1 Tax=Manduca sexta TaxID=7130 RepID=UPI0011836CA1|nr:uncharacterized protein LOC115441757 isoform X2 [Manduca sexta]
MDNDSGDENNDSENSSVISFSLFRGKISDGVNKEIDLGDYFDKNPFTFASQTKKPECETFGTQVSRPASILRKSNEFTPQGIDVEIRNLECTDLEEPFCHVKLDSILKLKDSTKKLLSLLEEIQAKTHTKAPFPNEPRIYDVVKSLPENGQVPDNTKTVTDVIGASAIKKLETQTKDLDAIYIEEYNDFIIHFNEDTKYYTSNVGEIIKNMRILKKFLYMSGGFTKNALMFLNEGLSESSHSEKVEIIQGISHADVCNVFEEQSIVTICISWPCKYENYGDSVTQALASGFLFRLAQLEEGRRYLKFSSKITNDIKRLLRKKSTKLEFDTVESLNSTLNLLHPPMTQHLNVTYYCKPVEEGFGNKTIKALVQYRQYMTLEEIFTHLDLLHTLSNKDMGRKELTLFLPALLSLFKNMLLEYDNSEINIIITNILNNIVARNIYEEQPELPKTMIIADTATEPISMKNEINQVPNPKKNKHKKFEKSKLVLTPTKLRQTSKRKVSDWETPSLLNRSKKFTKVNSKNPIIFVPVDK